MNLKSCIEKIEKLSRDYRHSDMDNVEYISELYPLLVSLSEFSEIEAKLADKDRQLEAAVDDIVGEWIDENGPCDTSEMKQMFRKRWEGIEND